MKNINTAGRATLMSKTIGTSFENYLAEEGIVVEVYAAAKKSVLVWEQAEAMKSTEVPCALIEFAKNHPKVTTLSLVCYCPRCTTTC